MPTNYYFDGPRSVFVGIPAVRALLPLNPSYSSNIVVLLRTRKVSFGDGYDQRAPDGINDQPLSFKATWRNRSLTVARELMKFFKGETPYDRRPIDWFWMTPPLPFENQRKFVVEGNVEMVYEQANSYTISVTLREVFDP
jgi:phage-related protein